MTKCRKCGGTGKRGYANTSTWRHGIGGQVMTEDICDYCWGTGDSENPGINLRTQRLKNEN